MSVITLSTVGYSEVINSNNYPNVRIFTIILILFGVGNILFLFSSITAFLTSIEIKKFFLRKKNMHKIKKTNQHIIICGIGNVGCRVLFDLDKFLKSKKKSNYQIIAIEKDPLIIEKIQKQFPKLIIVEGDATDEKILKEAGIGKASQIICTMNDDRDNIVLTVTAKKINPHCRIVAKTKDYPNQEKVKSVGADAVISPQVIGASRLAEEIIRPHTIYFIDKMLQHDSPYRLQEILVHNKDWAERKNLGELKINKHFGMPVIALKDQLGKFNYTPNSKDILLAGYMLILICSNPIYKKIRFFLKNGKIKNKK